MKNEQAEPSGDDLSVEFKRGWDAALASVPQQAEPRDVCDVCNALTVPRNATRYDADDLKAAQVRGKIIAARLQQAEPVEIVPRVWREALRKLTFMVRTSGGTPGPDEGLQTACAEAETLLSKPYNYPPAAPQQAEPVWVRPDQLQKARQAPFLCRVSPTKDALDLAPLYLHPPCSNEVQRLRDAALALTGERDAAIGMLAYWCVAVDHNGTGWDDWDEHYKDAMYRPCLIRGLLDSAIDDARTEQGLTNPK